MDHFPPNSAKVGGAPQDKRVEQVTSAEGRRRKKSIGKQFRETFVGGDAKSAANYVFFDVLLPEAKSVLVDAVSQGFERLIYGESRGGRRPNTPSGYSGALGRVNYQGMAQRAVGNQARQMSSKARQQHDFGEIQVASRNEANDVLDRMYDLLSKYEMVTVADLYSLTGISSTHVDHKWGWTELRGATSRRIRSGDYVLDLPNPEYLD